MKISEILSSNDLKLLTFTFFNLNKKNSSNEFYFRIQYREREKSEVPLENDTYEYNNKLMKEYLGLDFKRNGARHEYELDNDLGLSRNDFLTGIYKKIQQSRFIYSKSEFEEILYMSIFAFRGSIDTNRMLYAVDILGVNISETYLQQLLSLLISSEGAKQLNLNFRELQPEYVIRARNTQLRINLRWFYEKYSESMKKINIYKYDILIENKDIILGHNARVSMNDGFISRLIFYKEKILGLKENFYKLSKLAQKNEIKKLREELEFRIDEVTDDVINRDADVVKLALVYYPDECVCCKDKYKIEDRTFLQRKNEKPYLEVHHVISFKSDKDSDVLENLVKVCPACHKALTPNRATEDYQKMLIKNILKNSPFANEYLNNFVSEDNMEYKVDYIYDKLK